MTTFLLTLQNVSKQQYKPEVQGMPCLLLVTLAALINKGIKYMVTLFELQGLVVEKPHEQILRTSTKDEFMCGYSCSLTELHLVFLI